MKDISSARALLQQGLRANPHSKHLWIEVCVCVGVGGGGCVWEGGWMGEWVDGWMIVCVCVCLHACTHVCVCVYNN